MFQTAKQPPLEDWVKSMLVLWFILLVPWPIAAMGAGMSGEGGGNHAATEVLARAVVSYPILVFFAFVFRRRKPHLVFLPAVSLLVGFIAASMI
jgi:hypothetical protein